jgi:hypothetical protein
MEKKMRSKIITAIVCGALSGHVFATPVSPITFTGPSTLGPIQVTNTDTTVAGSLTAPALLFPEIDVPATNDQSDGFFITGRFDFLNGTGTSAELTFTAMRPVSVASGTLFTSSAIDGQFGIDSTDVGAISSTDTDSAATANLDNFSETTFLQSTDVTPVTLAASSVTAADSGKTIPLTLMSFPTNSVDSVAGPNFAGPFSAINSYMLVQTVDIKISGLLPGETVDIDLPTTSTLDTVPEPASAAVVLGALTIAAAGRKRFHSIRNCF